MSHRDAIEHMLGLQAGTLMRAELDHVGRHFGDLRPMVEEQSSQRAALARRLNIAPESLGFADIATSAALQAAANPASPLTYQQLHALAVSGAALPPNLRLEIL